MATQESVMMTTPAGQPRYTMALGRPTDKVKAVSSCKLADTESLKGSSLSDKVNSQEPNRDLGRLTQYSCTHHGGNVVECGMDLQHVAGSERTAGSADVSS